MDGMLALLLIGWILASLKKKSKSAKKTPVNGAIMGNAAQQRAERLARMHAELEKRKMQQVVQNVQTEETIVMSEGESNGDSGSMQFDSAEGECICDPALEHECMDAPEPGSVHDGEIGGESMVDFTAKGILQGVVMSEILSRPSQRVKRLR